MHIQYGEYFFGSPKLLFVSPFYLFSSLKLSLHRFCSPSHCFYSLYHRFSFSSVARSRCSPIHWINSFLTKITHSKTVLRFSPPDQAPRQKWRFSGSADDCVRGSDQAEDRLAELPSEATWIWSDGSAFGGVMDREGATISFPSGDNREVRVAAGCLCSSTRAELFAVHKSSAGGAVESRHPCRLPPGGRLYRLNGGASPATERPGRPESAAVAAAIWELLRPLADRGQPVYTQWVPAHCGLSGNERADVLVREASALPQHETRIDTGTVQKAVARSATATWQRSWPAGQLLCQPFVMTNGSVPSWGTDYRPGRGRGSPRRGGHTPAPGRPLELLGAVPSPDRPSTDAWMWAVQRREVSWLPDAGSVRRRRTHRAMSSAPVPGTSRASPAAPGHHQPGGDRRQSRRLPRPTEPPRLRPVMG